MAEQPKPATPATTAANKAAIAEYAMDDRSDFADADRAWTMRIADGVLNARRGRSDQARLTVTGPKAALVAVLLKPAGAARLAEAKTITLEGDESALTSLGELLDDFDPNFPMVAP